MTEADKKQVEARGMTVEQVENQLQQLSNGFPFLRIVSAAAVDKGIEVPTEAEQQRYLAAWQQYKEEGHKIVKFVPASGAASRMFKDLFAFLTAPYDVPTTEAEKTFFDGVKKFAFSEALCAQIQKNEGKTIQELLREGRYKEIVSNLLEEHGLNYGQLPKGLLLFHKSEGGPRTPMEEHLVEAALYASSKGQAHIHFTVSHQHLALFRKRVEERVAHFAQQFGVQFDITFSEQKPSTDTVAAQPDGTPFRQQDGSLLFRPGGHGALIQNLNDLQADVVFIKNIDNVVPDRLKAETVHWKQILAGRLITLQQQAFRYMEQLEAARYTKSDLEEMIRFVQRDLCCRNNQLKHMEDAELVEYLKGKLHRPMRVCGVVRNVGEPGGGPFLVEHEDGSVDLQILESSQIDMSNEAYRLMFTQGTHFNPVDLVCATRDHHGQSYQLPDFVDPSTGFVSQKSKDGRELKALELPGLWNGAMSNWCTVFLEVPLSTFNPVKTVNDLLRDAHQA